MGQGNSKPERPLAQQPPRSPTPPPKFVPCWRNMPWQNRLQLKTNISQYYSENSSVPLPNIVLFGLVGSGKSSFTNTVDSIFKGRISGRGEVGSAAGSVTKMFRMYRPGNPTLNFRLCDTMGMEEDQGLDMIDMPYVLDGHIPDKFKFPAAGSHITRRSPLFNSQPTAADGMHCICYVMDAKNAKLQSSDTVRKIKKLKELASSRNIRFVILLTKIDELCPEVERDVSNAYKSYALNQVVKEISTVSGIPISYIHLIKNYCSEVDLDPRIDVLVMRALQQILGFVDDILQDID